jgi:hypothetical protein
MYITLCRHNSNRRATTTSSNDCECSWHTFYMVLVYLSSYWMKHRKMTVLYITAQIWVWVSQGSIPQCTRMVTIIDLQISETMTCNLILSMSILLCLY